MPRILRNYLISFALIGLLALGVHLVNRWAEEKAGQKALRSPPSAESQPAPPSR